MIDTSKMYEVQKYCSLTNHMWDGYWWLVNRRSWAAIPADLREIVANNINQGALDERKDVEALNASLQTVLGAQGFGVQQGRPSLVRRAAQEGRLLYRVEGQVRRRGLGPSGAGHGQADLTPAGASLIPAPHPQGLLRRAEASTGCGVGCGRRHLLVVVEMRGSVGGRLVAFRVQRTAGLDGRTRILPLPVAGDAREPSSRLRRSVHMRMSALTSKLPPGWRSFFRRLRDGGYRQRLPASTHPTRRIDYTIDQNFITSPALRYPGFLARCRPSSRTRASCWSWRCSASQRKRPASRRVRPCCCADDGGRCSCTVARVPSPDPAGQDQSTNLLRRRRQLDGVRGRADRLLLRA